VTETIVIYQDHESKALFAESDGDELWLTLAELKSVSGWELKPEGVCKDEICVPVPEHHPWTRVTEDRSETLFNLSEFARHIGQPFAHDDPNAVWYFGPASWEWKDRLASRQAPDFSLPDLSGRMHALSELRGKKVFLLFRASW
jgi:hypothetical protein